MRNIKKIKVGLRPIVNQINLPTVLKTAILPNTTTERLFIATQTGEIYYVGDRYLEPFLDIREKIITLGEDNDGFDERGLLGLAFHPQFSTNGRFYLHYSVAGTQGPGAFSDDFQPNPCQPASLLMQWTNREIQYDHIDTIEEWIYRPQVDTVKRATLLNIRRPFANHNGVNSLDFSPETGNLLFTNGDGGLGYDPFNLSQDDLEIAGKVIEIDISTYPIIEPFKPVTRFEELPEDVQRRLFLVVKGVRNAPGVVFQKFHQLYVKYIGFVGQECTESVFTFLRTLSIPVSQLVHIFETNGSYEGDPIVNLGWRGWEGELPTLVPEPCQNSRNTKKIVAYFQEAINLVAERSIPLTSYYHHDTRPHKFQGTALTAVQPYQGVSIPDLQGCVVFTDFAKKQQTFPSQGVLAYTNVREACRSNDFQEIEVTHNFGSEAAYYVSLGADFDQTHLFLGVYGSANVTDPNKGAVFEIVSP